MKKGLSCMAVLNVADDNAPADAGEDNIASVSKITLIRRPEDEPHQRKDKVEEGVTNKRTNDERRPKAGGKRYVPASTTGGSSSSKARASASTSVPGPNTGGKSSQYLGVSWKKQGGKWLAQIKIMGTSHHLGYFDDEREAALAYDVEARKLGQETNFPEASTSSESSSAKARTSSSTSVPGLKRSKQTQETVSRPKGRAPAGKEWNSATGKWDEASTMSKESASSRPSQNKEMEPNTG